MVKKRRFGFSIGDVVELDAAVVDAGQSALVVAVRGGDARQVVALVVTDRHHEAVHAVVDVLAVLGGDQLSENRCHFCCFGCTADVVLAGRAGGRVDDELLGCRIVGGRGLDRLHVAAVAGLGHREAAEQIQVDEAPHVGLMVTFGAQVFDRPAEQTPLHARLDHQRQIAHRQHLDLRDRGADVTVAAVLLLEPVLGGALGGHDLQLLRDLGAGDDGVRRVVRSEDLGGEFLAHPVLHVAPASVQRVPKMFGSRGHEWTVARERAMKT
jgi:hypothetical protein